jgi:D-alanyl-lipoteichoic acid acyltransferase DltB (MBOAT superfamily)
MFESLWFWALLVVTAASFYVTSKRQVSIRAAVVAVASLVALVLIVKLKLICLVLLLGMSAWIFIGLRLTRDLAARRTYVASAIVFFPVLVLWVMGKQAAALGWTPLNILFFIGFSFYLVKAWTLIRDYHEQRIERLDPFVVFAYFLFFPAYIAGPMHYFGEFDGTIRNRLSLDGEALVDATFRILLGFTKIKLVAALLVPFSLEAIKTAGHASLRRLVFASFIYSIVIWADFSGYSDLAIGTSRLMGMRTPENFNYPYAARNIRDFWQRWHITFSRVLTSYIFVPISRNLQRAIGDRRKTILVVAYLATFLFCGYWHGPTLNFLLWGVYHGLALIIYDFYRQRTAKRRLQAAARSRFFYAEPLIGVFSRLLTFALVSIGWIFFVLPAGMIFRRLR